MLYTSKSEALKAVEQAPWDEYGGALSGSDIWGTQGQFAGPRAANNFTYERAIGEVERYFDNTNQ